MLKVQTVPDDSPAGLLELLTPSKAPASPFVHKRPIVAMVTSVPASPVKKKLEFVDEEATVVLRQLLSLGSFPHDQQEQLLSLGSSAPTQREPSPSAPQQASDSNVLKQTLGLPLPADGARESLSLLDIPKEFVRRVVASVLSPAPAPTPVRPVEPQPEQTIEAPTLSAREKLLYKTAMCRSEERQAGSCPYGASCQYAHTAEELQEDPLRYTELCKSKIVKGHCSFGKTCKYAHSEAELRPLPLEFAPRSWKGSNYKAELCKAFKRNRGFCPHGKNCHFAHYQHELSRSSNNTNTGGGSFFDGLGVGADDEDPHADEDKEDNDDKEHLWSIDEVMRADDREREHENDDENYVSSIVDDSAYTPAANWDEEYPVANKEQVQASHAAPQLDSQSPNNTHADSHTHRGHRHRHRHRVSSTKLMNKIVHGDSLVIGAVSSLVLILGFILSVLVISLADSGELAALFF